MTTSTARAESPSFTATIRDFVTGGTHEVEIPPGWTVDYATGEIARSLDLPERDSRNRPQLYELFVRRARGGAERLRPTARIGDVVAPDDVLEPLPEIIPGGGQGGPVCPG